MSENKSDIVVDFVDYVFDENNVFKKEKYLGGRVMNGQAFGTEAHLRLQYCTGGYFAEGWAGNIKFRVYGVVTLHLTPWRFHVCPIDDVINENDHANSYAGESKEELLEDLKAHILASVEVK